MEKDNGFGPRMADGGTTLDPVRKPDCKPTGGIRAEGDPIEA